MKLLVSLLVIVLAVIAYVISTLPVPFWIWIQVFTGITLFSIFAFPYLLAWIVNFFLSKGKRFSVSIDKLSPLGLNAKNVTFSIIVKQFLISGSVKKVGIQTNFRKSFLNIGASSPFILEVDSVTIGLIPNDQAHSSSADMKKEPKEESAPHPIEKRGNSASLSALRHFLPLLRLLDLHINNIVFSLGDTEFPKRIEVVISDVQLNGSVQFTPATMINGLFSISTISLNNRENAFDSQPNILLNSFWIRCSCEFSHRFLVRQLTWNVGDSLQMRIDKSLYRQIFAVIKAMKFSSPPQKHSEPPQPKELQKQESIQPLESNKETMKTTIVHQISSLIRILPQAVKVTLPKMDLDLVNADKSNNTPTSIHILLGVTLKCSTSFYDVFASTPRSLMMALELSTLQSNYFTCDGIEASITVMLRETKSKFESISLNYNHKKTVLRPRPSILRTLEYIQSMAIHFPFKSSPKKSPSPPSSGSRLPDIMNLIKESQVRVDVRIEELQLSLMVAPCIPSSVVEISLQTLAFTLAPANSRVTLETPFTSSYELQAKIGAVEVCTIPYSREGLQSLLNEEEQDRKNPVNHLPPCSDKVVSIGGLELDCTMNKWERFSVECSSKSCNLVFTYSSVDLMMFVLEVFVKEVEEYRERSAGGMNKTNSFSSLDFSRSASSASLSEVSVTSPIPPSPFDSPVILETMDSDEINRQLLQSILDDSLLPSGMEDVAGIDDLDVTGPFTPSSSPQPLSGAQPSSTVQQLSQQSHNTPHPLPPQISPSVKQSPISTQLGPVSPQKNSIKQEAVSDGESDEILLSDDEIDITKPSVIRFIPLYLSDATLRINSVEVQITGKDTSRSTSYTMESLTVSIVAKNNDTFEKYVSSLLGEFGDTFNSQPFNLPVYTSPSVIPSQPIPTNTSLSPVDESLATPLDLNSIPHFNVKMDLPRFNHQPPPSLPSFHSFHSLTNNFYTKNPVVEYKMTLEISNVSVLGDEGIHVSKSQLPVFIPQIGISFPSFLFLSMSKSQLPEQLNTISFSANNIEYKAHSIGKWAGFYRGDEHLVFISANSRDVNCLQIVISSLCTRLSFGSIYVVMNSLLELVALVKTGIPRKSKPLDETPKPVKRHIPSLFFKVVITLRQLTVTFHFTPKAGILLTIEELAAAYPDSASLPLLSLRSIQASQIQMTQVTCAMVSIDSLAVYSPGSYSEIIKKNGIDMSNRSISELRECSLYLTKCSCGHCDICHRFQPCSSCQSNVTDSHQCNGYDNQCNLRTDHVPTGVQPYLVLLNKVDCLQDMRWQWGDLIYDACLQWKAFKTIRKGLRPPPVFPHPDEDRAHTVADHEAFSPSTILSGIWIQLVVDSVLLRLQDIIPHISPESREYSCLVVTGLDGVVTYNRQMHSRAHLLSFLQAMDDSPTPLAKGFDDVLGLHIHDLYVDSIETSFADQPPLVVGYNLYACGTFVLADMNRVESYIRREQVELFCSSSFDPLQVEVIRTSISTKFYQNFNLQAKQLDVFWGAALWWVRQSFTESLSALTPRGVSKSPKMAWYDKLRFSVHGPITLQVFDSLHLDWVTYRCIDDQYESLVLELTNPNIIFKKEGGCIWEFDVFSIGVSKFDSSNQLVLSPLYQALEGAWQVTIHWKNKESSNHYVELNDAVSDDVDKYMLYRSNTIEWDIQLGPYHDRDFNSSFFLRAELADFLLGFWDMLITVNPDFPTDYGPGLMRNSTDFEVRFILDNSSFWMYFWSESMIIRFNDDSSDNGFNLISKKFELVMTMYKLLPLYLERIGRKDVMNMSEKPDYSGIQ